MAKRKTTPKSATTKARDRLELLRQKTDMRTTWGQEAWEAMCEYLESGDYKKIALLEGIASHLGGSNLERIDGMRLDDYVKRREGKDLEGRCACGQPLSAEVFRVKFTGHRMPDGIESEVVEKIRAKESLQRQSTVLSFGVDCFNSLPEMLKPSGIDINYEPQNIAIKAKTQELEDIIINPTPELQAQLLEVGIDPAQFALIGEVFKFNTDIFSNEAIAFQALDPGSNRNFGNWFRERYNQHKIMHEDIVNIYDKLTNAAHVLTPKELSLLAVYQLEYRAHSTRSMAGSLQDDLLFLAKLPANHPIRKKYGKFNIDKHYVLPSTRFKSRAEREALEKRSIRKVLGIKDGKVDEKALITGLEVIGLHNHFPNLRKTRVEVNRGICNRYALNEHEKVDPRYWDRLIDEIRPVFDADKDQYRKDYQNHGQVLRGGVLTQDEYSRVKEFFKRSSFWGRSERDNYLNFHSIAHFQHVVPEIVAIGRKLKLSRKFQEGNEELESLEVLKDTFTPLEDLDLQQTTGIVDYSLNDLIDLFNDTTFVKHSNYQKFTNKYGSLLRKAYTEGIVPDSLLKLTGSPKKSALQRYYEVAIGKGVVKIGEDDLQQIEDIRRFYATGLVTLQYGLDVTQFNKFMLKSDLNEIHKTISKLKEIEAKFTSAGYDLFEEGLFEKLALDVETLKGKHTLELTEGKYVSLSNLTVSAAYSHPLKYYDVQKINKNLTRLRDTIEVTQDLADKLEIIQENHRYIYRSNSMYVSYNERIFRNIVESLKEHLKAGEEIYAKQDLIDKINQDYDILVPKVKAAEELQNKRLNIEHRMDITSKIKEMGTVDRTLQKLNLVCQSHPKLADLLELLFPKHGIAVRVHASLRDYEAGRAFENIDEVAEFDWAEYDIDEMLNAKEYGLSQLLRKNLTEERTRRGRNPGTYTVQLSDAAKATRFRDSIYYKICNDEHIMRLAKGLASVDEEGNRKLTWSSKAKKKLAHYHHPLKYNRDGSSQTEANKKAFFKFSCLGRVATGEDAQYQIPNYMKKRFEEDIKEGIINTNTFEYETAPKDPKQKPSFGRITITQLRDGMQRFENLVNNALLEGYTLRPIVERENLSLW